jgi:hypothetical protein
VCRAGASWVRDNILRMAPDADVAVYVVWLPMLPTDAASEIETGLVGDPRARHFWDGDRVVGRWLADARVAGESAGGIVWDAFYVFGPEAVWNEKPAPVLAFGGPVVSEAGALERALKPLLR